MTHGINSRKRVSAGYTPLFDDMLAFLQGDTIGALVFGVIWRHEQMADGYCWASVATIAKKLGVSKRSVQRRLDTLRKYGYVKEIMPATRHMPRGYMVAYTPQCFYGKPRPGGDAEAEAAPIPVGAEAAADV
jgi:biotin operon repressor